MALMGLLFTACLKEETSGASEGGEKTLSVGLPSVQSKTWLDYANKEAGQPIKVYWSDGDQINVNGQSSLPLKVEPDTKLSQASFQLPTLVPPYNIIYPAGIVTGQEYDSDGAITVQLPSVQAYTEGSFASGAALMCGFAETLDNVQVNNLCAAIRVNIKGTDEIVDAKLSSASATAPLCGTFKLAPKEGTLTVVEGQNELSLKMDQVSLNSNAGIDFFFTVPAGDYSEGLTFYFTRKKDRLQMQNVWLPKAPLEAGKLYSFNDVDYIPMAKDIETAEEWEEFATAMNSEDGDVSKYLHKGGLVRLGADIEAENLTSITSAFPYIFEGNGKTITRTSATKSLFSKLQGEIRNLTLAGELNLTGEGAPFVTNMYAGAKITGCTNNMDVTFALSTHCYVTGFAAIAVRNDTEEPELLEISNCTNNGKIEGTVNVSTANYNTAVAGFIADVRSAVGNFDYDVKLVNCKNTAPITLAPISGTSTTYGMSVCGVAGIIGWCRDIKSLTLNDCDNSGAITVKADYINSVEGLKACVAAAGGIIGVGSNVGSGKINTNGREYSLIECDNTATIYNCMVNSSAADDIYNKVYTGGLAGVLIGKADQFATVKSCTNTGNVFSYDICSDDNPKPEVVSINSAYSAVIGGFIGIGGNLDLDGCTVNCQIGNGKRPMVAWGGVIGYIIKPFSIKDINLTYDGYFQRVSTGTAYKFNRGVIGVPAFVKVNKGTESEPKYEYEALDISGSAISGYLNTSGILHTATDLRSETEIADTKNLSSKLTSKLFNSPTSVSSNIINGGPANNATKLMGGVENNATISYK